MKLTTRRHPETGAVLLEAATNCDSDALPLIRAIEVRHLDVAFETSPACLAAAVIFERYLGAVAEFICDPAISLDYATAVSVVARQVRSVYPLNAEERAFGGDDDLVVLPARVVLDSAGLSATDRPVRVVTWSGDSVDPSSCASAGRVRGGVFTNAELVAGPLAVSAAIGLLAAGRHLRSLTVLEPDKREQGLFKRLESGLRLVGINLRTITGSLIPVRTRA